MRISQTALFSVHLCDHRVEVSVEDPIFFVGFSVKSLAILREMLLFLKCFKVTFRTVLGSKSSQMAQFLKDYVLIFTDLYCVSAWSCRCVTCKALLKIGAAKLFVIFSVVFYCVSVQGLN